MGVRGRGVKKFSVQYFMYLCVCVCVCICVCVCVWMSADVEHVPDTVVEVSQPARRGGPAAGYSPASAPVRVARSVHRISSTNIDDWSLIQ